MSFSLASDDPIIHKLLITYYPGTSSCELLIIAIATTSTQGYLTGTISI